MEGSIKAEKIQAMKSYKRAQFLYNIVLYSLTSLITLLFFSYPFWFPYVKHLIFSLPNDISFLLNAKCTFLVGNLIVIILIGESKLARPSHSSPASDVYDEYIARSRSYYHRASNSHVHAKDEEEDRITQQSTCTKEKRHENIKKPYRKVCKSIGHQDNKREHQEKKKDTKVCKSEAWGESDAIVKRAKAKGSREEQHDMPTEELNKRVEAFIARVNKQRFLEAKLVDRGKRLK